MVTLAGELLSHAERLLRSGLHPSDIITGFEIALKKTREVIEKEISLKISPESKDFEEKAIKIIESSLAPKMPSYY